MACLEIMDSTIYKAARRRAIGVSGTYRVEAVAGVRWNAVRPEPECYND
jgi:hypothetical protein